MSIKALIFDFGNVVGFFDHRRATNRLLPHSCMDADELHRLLHEGPLAEQYERGAVATEYFRAAVKQAAGIKCADCDFDEAYADIFWHNDALCGWLPELAQRYTLLLLSNTNDLHARKFRDQFAGPLGVFKHIILSHEVGLRKPDLEVYAHATKAAGCTPREVVFVDDLPANIAGARAAGWNGIVFTSVEELRKHLG